MNLGTVFRTLGQLEAAMDAYGKAYDLNPDSAMLCTLIGWSPPMPMSPMRTSRVRHRS